MRLKRSFLSCCLSLVFLSHPVNAHHAAGAVFTDEEIEIEGVVTEFNFKNPHVNIMLNVTDQNGVETLWMATGPAAPPMRRWGWTDSTVKEGETLRLVGKKSRTGAPMLLMESAEIQGGRFAVLDPVDRSVLRVLQETPDDSQSLDASVTLLMEFSDGRPNLSGMWLGGFGREPVPPPPFNQVGAALQARFDSLNDPAFASCSPHGLVRQATSGHPLKITQYQDYVVFEYEQNSIRRVIYLDGRSTGTTGLSAYGRHTARYEGGALIVESSQLTGRLTGVRGNELSDESRVTETYRRIDSPETGPAIGMRLVVNDPGHLTATWELGWRKNYAATDYHFVDTECMIPLSAGD
jgi:hypothetical protein